MTSYQEVRVKLTNTKLSKLKFSTENMTVGSFGSWLGNLGKKVLKVWYFNSWYNWNSKTWKKKKQEHRFLLV